MTVTTFVCDSCGANISLSELSNITVCPFCNKDYWLSSDWEESVRIATKKAEQIMVDTIRDITIPEVNERILRKDLEAFRKVNESIVLLDETRQILVDKKAVNDAEKQDIESKVGYNYDGLLAKAPLSPLQIILALLHLADTGCSGMFILIIILAVVCIPIGALIALMQNGYDVATVILVVIFLSIIVFLVMQTIKRGKYFEDFDDKKRAFDLERIDIRKHLLKENVRLSLDIELLNNVISELKKLASTASILRMTNQFNGLSPMDVVKKIDFAINRMLAAPIEFDVACTGFNPNEVPITIPFANHYKTGDINTTVNIALRHIGT